jgi:hypothetical protein
VHRTQQQTNKCVDEHLLLLCLCCVCQLLTCERDSCSKLRLHNRPSCTGRAACLCPAPAPALLLVLVPVS